MIICLPQFPSLETTSYDLMILLTLTWIVHCLFLYLPSHSVKFLHWYSILWHFSFPRRILFHCIQYHILLFHLSVGGYLGCFHILGLVWWGILQWSWVYKYLFETLLPFVLPTYLEMEWKDHMLILFLFFEVKQSPYRFS